jgi:putative membrane protein
VTDQKNRGSWVAVLLVLLGVAILSRPFRMMRLFGLRPWIIGRALTGGRIGWPLLLVGGLIRLVFWGVVVVAVLFLVRPRAGGSARSLPESALDILKRRYAAGELTREQYEQMRRDVES